MEEMGIWSEVGLAVVCKLEDSKIGWEEVQAMVECGSRDSMIKGIGQFI